LTTLPDEGGNALPASAMEILDSPTAEQDSGPNNIERPGSVSEIAKELAEQRRANSREQDAEREAFARALGETPEPPAQEEAYAEDETKAYEGAAELLRAEAQQAAEIAHRAKAALAELQQSQGQTAAQTHLQQRVAQYEAAFAQEYPEAYSPQAEQELARNNPTRYAELHDRRAQYQRAIKADAYDALTNRQALAQNQQAEFNQAAQYVDARFDSAHPEFKDPRARRRMMEGVYEMFEKQGVSREQLQYLYQTNPAVRSHAGQEMILSAWRAHEKEKIMKTGRGPARVPPPPQRPGAAGEAPTRYERAVTESMRRLDQTGSVRDAAKALVARRTAARRGRA
jgi:hypothetical protein